MGRRRKKKNFWRIFIPIQDFFWQLLLPNPTLVRTIFSLTANRAGRALLLIFTEISGVLMEPNILSPTAALLRFTRYSPRRNGVKISEMAQRHFWCLAIPRVSALVESMINLVNGS